MKRQTVLDKMIKKAGEKTAMSVADKASVFYCYQPKEPKGLEKFNK
ncbi:MAG: cyclic lactone autoinducer peptide [Lachnospiraceae bacterium]